MKLAFDAACFTRTLDSMDRVLRVLVCAADHVGIEVELWANSALRDDAVQFKARACPVPKQTPAGVDALWSPELSTCPLDLPAVATLHDVNPLLADGRSVIARWRRQRRYRRSVNKTLNRVQRLVTDTEDAKQRVATAFPQVGGRLFTVPLFVDPQIAALTGPEGIALLEKLSLSPGYILFVGSMRRHKNWDGLMRAYATLPQSLQSAHPLVFAGRSNRARAEADDLINLLNIREHVHMTGVVDNKSLHALYGGARVLVCPSFMEGFGFPPLEAMACGIPVVASDRTCIPEVLGDAAYYIDPASTQSMTQGIEQVLGDNALREKQIAEGIKQAASYTPARTGEAMLAVLDSLLNS